jgi:ABC-type amino acid transport substrate-binding protein
VRSVGVFVALLLLGSQAFAAGTLEKVRDTKTFKVGYRADAKPYSYRNDKGEPTGYIVDLCREVAAEVTRAAGGDIKINYVVVPADQRFESVRDGRVDVLCDPASITLARREMVDFSLPIFLDGASILSRGAKAIESYRDLAGKRVGVLTGTTTERTLREALDELKISATIITTTDHRAGMDLLGADKIDAYFADRAIIAALLYEGGRPGFKLASRYFSYETYALALRRGDDDFRLVVDRTLAKLYRSGRIDTILAKTFGKTPSDEILKAMFIINSLPEK